MSFRLPWGALAGVWLASAVPVGAQVTTQESASILVFPKVVADGSWDTTIQIANGTNRPVSAVCYYVNAQLQFPELPEGPLNERLWIDTDFRIHLTRQQPTHWVVSRGRPVSESDPCDSTSPNCDAAGPIVGRIPPVPEDFIGELVCIELDASGAPWSGNGMRGQATLTHLVTGEVVKYPALGLTGLPTNNANGELCLGGDRSEQCALGAEYTGCPNRWTVSHPSDFDDRSTDGNASTTRFTLVPCQQDFDSNVPGTATVTISITNEFELRFSASHQVRCWSDFSLPDISSVLTRDGLGGDWLQTELRVAAERMGGFMLVQQTEREIPRPPAFTAVATTPHPVAPGDQNVITLPVEVIQ